MKKIFLIAGHNGPGTGANGFIDEGAETIVFRDLLDAELCKLGIIPETDFEREGNALNLVADWIKRNCQSDDICIDIHFNAASADANGSEVFIPSSPTPLEKDLADCICRGICSVLSTKNRGVRTETQSARGKLAMLNLPCHCLLLEICFCSNQEDAEKYRQNKFLLAERLAQIISKRI